MVNFPKLTSVTRVPLVEPINSYYMVIFPKLTSVTRVPLVEPINSYYMVIIGFFDDCLKEKKDDLLTCMASPQVKMHWISLP